MATKKKVSSRRKGSPPEPQAQGTEPSDAEQASHGPEEHPHGHRQGDLAEAKTALAATFSLVDKMANKGIIHKNAAGRYKSRLVKRIARKPGARKWRSG